MIKPYPRYTQEDNSAYDFFTGTELKYKTTIVLDELNDSLLMMPWHMPEVSEVTFCKCNDFAFRQHVCKHIQECLTYLKSVGIEYRQDEKPKKEDTNELSTEKRCL